MIDPNHWRLFVKHGNGTWTACACEDGTPCVVNLRWTDFLCVKCFFPVEIVRVGTVEIPFTIDATGKPEEWKLGLMVRLQESYALAAERELDDVLTFEDMK